MRKTVVRLSRVLLTIAGIGLMSMVVALLYFSGVASSVDINADPLVWGRLFFGFNYQILTAFGFFMVLIGLSPVLSVLDANAKKSVKKSYFHLLLLVGIGIIILIYSVLVYGDYLSTIDTLHTWFDYFIIAALLIIVGLSPILLSVQDRERLWIFKLFFALFILIGLLLQIISIVVYGKVIVLNGIEWDIFFLFGIIMLFLGMVPLLLTASPRFNEILARLRIIWILGVLIGIVLLIGSYLVYADIVPKSTVLDIDWFGLLAYGGLLIILTVLPLASPEQSHGGIKKLRYIWLVTFLVGFLLVIVSAILVLPTSPEVKGAVGALLGDEIGEVTWDIFYMYGTIITIVSLIFICSILYYETEDVSSPEGLLESAEKLPDIDATSNEMVAYLEILSQSNKSLINQFKEAVRADKFRPRVYEKIVKQYQDRNRTIKSRMEKFQKAGAIVTASDDVEALFDVALGEPSQAAPSIGVSAPPTPPATEAAKPAPPVPPIPPSQAPIPPPSPGLPPSPPLSPLATPPLPTAPSQPTESPLDLIADARSTSIAELRGEMLKELRRLREIFKEE